MRLVLPLLIVFACLPLNASKTPLKTVKIGIASQFTGAMDAAFLSADIVRGAINLALEQKKSALEKKGLKVEFVEADYQNDPLKALEVSRKFVKSDVLGVVGYGSSGHALLAAPIHEAAGLPMITPSATATRLRSYSRFVHLGCVDNRTFADSLAQFAIREKKAKKAVMLVAADCSYCCDLASTFQTAYSDLGGKVVDRISVLSDQKDFSSVVKKLKKLDFDIVLNPNYKLMASRIIAALSKEGFSQPHLFADGWGDIASNIFSQITGRVNFEAFAVDHWHNQLKNNRTKQFVRKYRQKYSYPPDTTAVLWYDSMSLVLEAVLKTTQVDREGFEKALKGIRSFEGVAGRFEFGESNVPAKPTILSHVKNGKFRLLKSVKAVKK